MYIYDMSSGKMRICVIIGGKCRSYLTIIGGEARAAQVGQDVVMVAR